MAVVADRSVLSLLNVYNVLAHLNELTFKEIEKFRTKRMLNLNNKFDIKDIVS